MKNRIINSAVYLFILILSVFSCYSIGWAQPSRANLAGTVNFFGYQKSYSLYIAPRTKWKELPERVMERNSSDIKDEALQLFFKNSFIEFGIEDNDLAKVLYVVAFIGSISFEEDSVVRSLSQMVKYERSNRPSRVLLGASLCQMLGYSAMAVSDDRGEYHLAVSFCADDRIDSMATNASFGFEGRIYYLVDLSLKSPVGFLPEEPGSSFRIIGKSPKGRCVELFTESLTLPAFPVDSTVDKYIAYSIDFQGIEYELNFYVGSNLAAYVANFPLSLPLFFTYTQAEMMSTGSTSKILTYLEGLKKETDRVNFLLSVVQDSSLCFYAEGPIRPTTTTLMSQRADCDSRSQILAGLLLIAGYTRILVVTTQKHLTLALAPSDSDITIPGGKYILYKDRKHYFLDPAIVNGKWGTAIEAEEWNILFDLEQYFDQK